MVSSQVAAVYHHVVSSPIGPLGLYVNKGFAIVRIAFEDQLQKDLGPLEAKDNKYACGELALELEEYFEGKRRHFDLPVALEGSDFQRAVWERLRKLEFGERVSYMELARRLGRKDAARAVANAVARNPLPIIIPCHRVVRADGSLGEFALQSIPAERGRAIKKWLLDHESELR